MSILIVFLNGIYYFVGCSSGTGESFDVIKEPEIEELAREEPECSSDSDCDDGFECTVDSCAIGGVCSHIPVNSLCPSGQKCEAGKGCVDIGCTSDSDCNDNIDCTEDVCGAGGQCTSVPVDSNCPPEERCNLQLGCVPYCDDASDCSNGIFCDGDEICSPEFGCMPGEARDCNDNDECTEDFCDATCDCCVNKCTPSPTCTCPFVPSEAYNACYSLTPVIQEYCSMIRFNFTINQVCFSLTGSALQAVMTPFRGGVGATFSQIFPGSPDPNFNVAYTISGGCEEQYGMYGTFSDNEHFDATFTATFIDHDGFSCALGGCPNQSVIVEGTKIP